MLMLVPTIGSVTLRGICFPVAAAFALNCQDPVAAFLGAVVEMGKHEVAFLTRYSAQDGERILAQWTGYEPIKLDEVTTQLALPVFQQRSVDRFHVSLREHPEHTANLGPFLYRQRDVETIRQLMPQFILHKDFELRALPHGTDLAEAVYPLSAEISVLEGLAGLETTMHCQLAECPFFRFRICGRVPAIPERVDSCSHRRNMEVSYKLTPEQLEAITAS